MIAHYSKILTIDLNDVFIKILLHPQALRESF